MPFISWAGNKFHIKHGTEGLLVLVMVSGNGILLDRLEKL